MRTFILSLIFTCSQVFASAQQLSNDQFQLEFSGAGLSSLKHTQDVFDTDYILAGRALGDVVLRYRTAHGGPWKQVESATSASKSGSAAEVTYEVGRAIPTIATTSKANSSVGPWGTNALNDQIEPKSSHDQNIPFFGWGDHHGTEEWVEYNFDSPKQVSSVEVYWAIGSYESYKWNLPGSWKIQCRDGDMWKDVRALNPYGIASDRFNHVNFEPVTTQHLRIRAQLPKEATSAIYEWRVNTDKGKEVAPVSDVAAMGDFRLEGNLLAWTIDVRNQTLEPIEIADLGLALPFNTLYEARDSAQLHWRRRFVYLLDALQRNRPLSRHGSGEQSASRILRSRGRPQLHGLRSFFRARGGIGCQGW